MGVKVNKRSKMKRKFSPFNLVLMLILIVYSITIIYSVYFVLVTSLKTRPDFDGNFFGIPTSPTFDNILKVLGKTLKKTRDGQKLNILIFPHVIIYTVLYSLGSAFFAALVPCIMAYFAAKFDYKFSKVIYATVVIVMIVPIVGNMPATIKMLDTLNLYDKIYNAYIMKGNFVNLWFLVFFAAFKSVPNDYMEAAYIDGASEFRVMTRVILPLVRTTFATIMVIYFVDLWNDYQTPLMYLPSHPTLSMVVFELSTTTETGFSSAPVRMAACALMVIPTLVIFVLFKDKLMGNLTMGGIKG